MEIPTPEQLKTAAEFHYLHPMTEGYQGSTKKKPSQKMYNIVLHQTTDTKHYMFVDFVKNNLTYEVLPEEASSTHTWVCLNQT